MNNILLLLVQQLKKSNIKRIATSQLFLLHQHYNKHLSAKEEQKNILHHSFNDGTLPISFSHASQNPNPCQHQWPSLPNISPHRPPSRLGSVVCPSSCPTQCCCPFSSPTQPSSSTLENSPRQFVSMKIHSSSPRSSSPRS